MIININVLFIKQDFKMNKYFLETLNKRRKLVPYLYACTFTNMVIPWGYPLILILIVIIIEFIYIYIYIYIINLLNIRDCI